MSSSDLITNRVRKFREERGLSQFEVATLAGISRAAVSAIEGQRLIPSVATGLALANVFGCSVEELFGETHAHLDRPQWAWAPPGAVWRYWQAEVHGRLLNYPVERTGDMTCAHDGVQGNAADSRVEPDARRTLVLAGCDPAARLLSIEYQRQYGMRLIVVTRSSRQALDLLREGLVHVAGIHFATREHQDANQQLVQERLGSGFTLVRGANWQSGLTVSHSITQSSVDGIVKSRPRWIGRESGSAARHCLDQLIGSTKVHVRHIAPDHRGVAQAIRSGWADAGVCVRLVSEEFGLRFLPVQTESYDLCFDRKLDRDPRILALLNLLRMPTYRQLVGDLPGYETLNMGEVNEA